MNKILLCVTVCSLLGSAAAASGQASTDTSLNPVVMTVNGEPVYAVEVSITLQGVLSRSGQTGSEPSQEAIAVANQRMIEQKLLAQEARRFGFKADESRVQGRIEQAAARYGGREGLRRSLASGGASIEQLERFHTEADLVRVFVDSQIRPTVKVSDAEIGEFVDANPDFALVEERVHARHILITVPEDSDLATDERALARAEAARERAVAGEDFAELARELSDGPSAANGGDLGFFTRKRMLPNFAEAAFELESGEISGVVRTRYGYHVILVEEHLPAGRLDDETLRRRAMETITNRKTGELVGKLVKTLFDNAEIKIRE
jgi:peptidyl-prolyl cis-trans isomerase C